MDSEDYSESLERWPTPEDAGPKFDPIPSARRRLFDRLCEEHLTEREHRILVLYYGMDGEERTLKEGGQILGISGERVR